MARRCRLQLYRKVQAVEKIFRSLDRNILKFQETTALRCIPGCGVCCTKPGIEAAPLEFLPMAYHLFVQGRAVEIFEMLSRIDAASPCIFYDRLGPVDQPGRCLEHPHRGLICRLFGFSGTADRNGVLHLSTCRPLKEADPQRYLDLDVAVSKGLSLPRGPYYYMMLSAVDAELMTYYPLNTAIRKSLETVLGYYTYRRRRAG